jgi:DNA polymerase III sliding clamp (beta) subunit (PCNA family)
MTFVATDGHRLALVSVKNDGAKGSEIKAILPRRRFLNSGASCRATVISRFSMSAAKPFVLRNWQRLPISRMIDGSFRYEKVTPRGNDKQVEFERDRLSNAVRRVDSLE